MITSPDNSQLKLIRKLQRKKERDETGLFAAEGEDLVEAAAAAGWEPEVLLRAGEDVEPELLGRVSALGSAAAWWASTGSAGPSRAGGCRSTCTAWGPRQRGGGASGPRTRSATARWCSGPGCADPFGPKAVRASMGSLFARPPARGGFAELEGSLVALDAGAGRPLADADPQPPVVLCVGAEREGLPAEPARAPPSRASIPLRRGRPGVAQRRHGRDRGAVRARD